MNNIDTNAIHNVINHVSNVVTELTKDFGELDFKDCEEIYEKNEDSLLFRWNNKTHLIEDLRHHITVKKYTVMTEDVMKILDVIQLICNKNLAVSGVVDYLNHQSFNEDSLIIYSKLLDINNDAYVVMMGDYEHFLLTNLNKYKSLLKRYDVLFHKLFKQYEAEIKSLDSQFITHQKVNLFKSNTFYMQVTLMMIQRFNINLKLH